MVYRITDWHTVTTTAEGFKQSCYDEGPSYWRFNVYTDFFTYWDTAVPGSVYTSQSGATLRGGHAVLIIGWDDSKGAFLCKNSWGQTKGPNGDGTFWIAYSGHYYDLGFAMSNFDIAACSSASIPTLSEWGVIILLTLLVGSALWLMRRRAKLGPGR
jgi:hypothetical protein